MWSILTGNQSPEVTEMFALSYAKIFAFYLDLNFDRIIIEHSFEHNLSTLEYLNREMVQHADPVTTV